jgi:CcmD family protein
MKPAQKLIVAAIAAFVLLMPLTATAAQQQPPATADQQYVPVTGADQEQLPAAPLVIGAYSVVWIALVFYVWSIWQRLARVEREIAQVSRRIQAEGNR